MTEGTASGSQEPPEAVPFQFMARGGPPLSLSSERIRPFRRHPRSSSLTPWPRGWMHGRTIYVSMDRVRLIARTKFVRE